MAADIDKLERLTKLRDAGALSVSEFELEKRKLLSSDARRSPAIPGRTAILLQVMAAVAISGIAMWWYLDRNAGANPAVAVSRPPSPPPPTPAAAKEAKAELPITPPAAPHNPWLGEYRGEFEGDARGSLTISEGTRGQLLLSLGIGTTGCIGGIDAPLATLTDNEGLVAMPEDESGNACRITLKRAGTRITLSEEGCGYYHGFDCSFSGEVSRNR